MGPPSDDDGVASLDVGQDVFISHAFADGTDAAHVAQQQFQSRFGLSCFVSKDSIGVGRLYGEQISEGIAEAGVVLLILSSRALTSPHVAREVVIAAEHGVPIVPVRLTGEPLGDHLNYWLAGLQIAQHPGGLDEESCAELASEIIELIAERNRPAPSARIQRFTIPFERVERSERMEPPPRDSGSRVSTATPVCIVVLVDCSKSMNRRIGGSGLARRVVVTDQINMLFEELVDQSFGETGRLPYFYVAAIGYGDVGDRDMGSLLTQFPPDVEIVSIVELGDNVSSWVDVQLQVDLPDGTSEVQTTERPVWIEQRPLRRGDTLAKAAFTKAQGLCEQWVADWPNALPPIVLNITDGEYTDGDPRPLIRAIEEIATPHGNALVFNCHLSDVDGDPTSFPTAADAESFSGNRARLFEQSSELPRSMVTAAQEHGYDIQFGARGYVYNAEVHALADFFSVGTAGRLRVR